MKLTTTKFSLYLVSIAAAILLGFSGCVETTSDRGIVYGSPDRATRVGIRDLQVIAKLIDEKGLTVPGVSVYAETFRSKDSGITNSYGVALLNVSLGEDEAIELRFKSELLDHSESVTSIPQGLTKITAIFVLGSNRRIRLQALEF